MPPRKHVTCAHCDQPFKPSDFIVPWAVYSEDAHEYLHLDCAGGWQAFCVLRGDLYPKMHRTRAALEAAWGKQQVTIQKRLVHHEIHLQEKGILESEKEEKLDTEAQK